MSASYSHGSPANALRIDTIGGCMDRIAAANGNLCAVVSRHQGVRLTYADLMACVDRAASGLISLEVARGDRVGLWSRNCSEWLIIQLAVAKVGAILVHLNPAYKAGELEHAVTQSGVSVLITGEGIRVSGLDACLASARWISSKSAQSASGGPLRCVISVGGCRIDSCVGWSELCSRGDDIPDSVLRARALSVDCDDAANILYTSGTTGVPKGVTLSHHSSLNSGFFVGERMHYSAADRVCLPVPLCHSFGSIIGALATLTHGGTVVLPAPLFDAGACLNSIEEEGCTAFYGVPSMFAAVLAHPMFSAERLQTLRTGIMAGASCPPSLVRRTVHQMHIPQLTICYGTTETGTICQSLSDDPVDERAQTVGVVHPHVECKIVDPVSGSIVERGVTGELCARGYSLMSGYWGDPVSTQAVRKQGGWLATGDLAVMDENGRVSIIGRSKDVIISAGQNIYPREIEDLLRTHPKVCEAVVIGIPDDLYGEAACAWIQLHEHETSTADEMRRFCGKRAAAYKVPRRVKFTDQLPLTVTGKIQRFKLRERSIAEYDLIEEESQRKCQRQDF